MTKKSKRWEKPNLIRTVMGDQSVVISFRVSGEQLSRLERGETIGVNYKDIPLVIKLNTEAEITVCESCGKVIDDEEKELGEGMCINCTNGLLRDWEKWIRDRVENKQKLLPEEFKNFMRMLGYHPARIKKFMTQERLAASKKLYKKWDKEVAREFNEK